MKTQKENTSTQDAKNQAHPDVSNEAWNWWGEFNQATRYNLIDKYFPDRKLGVAWTGKMIETVYKSEHPSTPPMEEDIDLLSENVIGKPLEDYVKAHHTQEECIGFIDGYNTLAKENEELKKQVKVLEDALRTLVDRLNANWDAITSGGQNGILTALTKEAKQALNL